MSNLKVNTINDASGGSAAQLYGVSMRYGGTAFVNRIINGDMRIDQRNAGASVTPTASAYTIDRWKAWVNVSSKFSVQQTTSAPAGFVNSIGITSLSSYTIGSGEFTAIGQSIEGLNVADFGWGAAGAQSITISFWVRSSLTGTFGGSVTNSAGNRSYPFTYTISAANTWEQKSVTIAGDTSGTWLTTNGTGLQLFFGLGCGSSWSGTAGAWNSNYNLSATGATSVVGTNAATLNITGVQLEAGTVASPFERRDYGRELMMCQRYFERIDAAVGGIVTIGQAYTTSAAFVSISFRTTKRAAPTFSTTGTWTGLTATGSDTGGSLSLNLGETNFARLTLSGGAGLVAGNASGIYANTTASLQFSAEL